MKKLRTTVLTIIISIVFMTQFTSADTKLEIMEDEPEPPPTQEAETPFVDDELDIAWVELKVEEPLDSYNLNLPLDDEVINYIINKCEENNIDVNIFFALIKTESNYNHKVVGYNKNGSYDSGLCQINSSNQSWLASEGYDINNIYGNIDAGIYILKLNLEKTDYDYPKALTGYNTGKTDYVNNYAKKVIKLSEIPAE